MKLNEIYRAVLESGSPLVNDPHNPHHRRLMTFFSIGSGISRMLEDTSLQLKETLAMLENN